MDKAIEIENESLWKSGFEKIIQDYDFWLTECGDNENISLLFLYTLDRLCKIYDMKSIIDEKITDDQIENIFKEMIQDNQNNKKTIDLYKKEFHITW